MDGTHWLLTMAAVAAASIGCGSDGREDAFDARLESPSVDAAAPDDAPEAVPDAPPEIPPDAAPDAVPDATPEPPADVAISYIHAVLAVDDSGVRDTYIRAGQTGRSTLTIEFRRPGEDTGCEVLLAPRFVMFSSAYVFTRYFKTVVIDPAASELLENRCPWTEAPLLEAIAARGTVFFSWISPRWPESYPYLDTLRGGPFFGGSREVHNAGGAGFAMDADGVVSDTRIYPQASTLPPGLYGGRSL